LISSAKYERIKEREWRLDANDVIQAIRAYIKRWDPVAAKIEDHRIEVEIDGEEGTARGTWRNVEATEPAS
jgi:hypothetical protein